MPESRTQSPNRVLDPIARISEILFGLIMVLTFTCSISVGEAGRQEIRTILVGAIGCNLAWGLVDAVMYLMSSLTERARNLRILQFIRRTSNPQEAHSIIGNALPPVVASILGLQELETIRKQLNLLPEPPRTHLRKEDWVGAVGVFLLVFLSTFPVIIPFLFIRDARLALRLSNGIAIVLLFLSGYTLGRYAGDHPWQTGLWMVIVGIVLVGITMALGG
jgi:VIT family